MKSHIGAENIDFQPTDAARVLLTIAYLDPELPPRRSAQCSNELEASISIWVLIAVAVTCYIVIVWDFLK
jgi:hypothetical protein